MRKTIAAATVAASMAVGGLTGAVLGVPGVAGAAETATGAAGWVQDALSGLVDDGTIDQAQAGAVADALREARPERLGRGHHHVDREAVAEALGITTEELRTALGEGKTIAEVAADEGVDLQVVIDAILVAHGEHLDEKVAAGDLTREEADERLAEAEERVTAMVNGERPARGGHPRRHMAGADA